ncbi:MAG: hypothetical protein H6748_21185 [Spirochaetaceae bacterium]|nr:hypothetical protein [Myxococcales bacterium]MCB9726574.1 hypothetical protein [Spirochaetaceae bacterium]HPG25791.1 hypothetical protein [Myxococcota bacterium]
MRRFRFRLEGVLRIRGFELERARVRLAQLEQEARQRRARLEQARAWLVRGGEILARETTQGAEGPRLAVRAEGVSIGRLAVARAERALADLVPALQAAREAVRRARMQVRSLEKLRERRAEAHRIAALAAEQNELEELALARRGPREPGARLALEGRGGA